MDNTKKIIKNLSEILDVLNDIKKFNKELLKILDENAEKNKEESEEK